MNKIEQIKAESSEYIGQLESEDLEQEIERYLRTECAEDDEPSIPEIARHFAQWQREQFEKNRLAVVQTEEEYEREMAFATEIIEKEHRTPTFRDAINYGMWLMKVQMGKQAREHLAKEELTLADLVAFDEGMKLGRRLEKEQMMKDAVEGEILINPYPTICLDDCKDYDFKDGQKVRTIIVNED